MDISTHRGSIDASLKNLGILKNKGREKGANFRVFLNIGTVLLGVLGRSVLKRAAVEYVSFTLGNSLFSLVAEPLQRGPAYQREDYRALWSHS